MEIKMFVRIKQIVRTIRLERNDFANVSIGISFPSLKYNFEL